VVVRDVDTFSHCRACLLPFRCRCHIAYVPGAECVVGLSKLARLAEVYSRRLQTPLQLAQDIADGLASVLAARGAFAFCTLPESPVVSIVMHSDNPGSAMP
jgi:GTP cyclohydrolase I